MVFTWMQETFTAIIKCLGPQDNPGHKPELIKNCTSHINNKSNITIKITVKASTGDGYRPNRNIRISLCQSAIADYVGSLSTLVNWIAK